MKNKARLILGKCFEQKFEVSHIDSDIYQYS